LALAFDFQPIRLVRMEIGSLEEAAMPKLKVKNIRNEEVGDLELSDAIFGAEVKEHLLHEVVRMQLSRRRAGNACTKERSAVAGGGAKPYRQKGTGRARQGTPNAPNHVGGGIVFGPRPRSYDFSPPKKVRRGAMCSALSLFVGENRVTVVDDLELPEIKTKELGAILTTLGADSALLIDSGDNRNLKLSARNLSDHQYLPTEGLNVYDLLKHNQLVISKRAVLEVQERLEKPSRARKVGE
jgi:large subunit ribosomal protein L4